MSNQPATNTQPARIIELKETSAAGDRNPLNCRYFANGKRISRDEFYAIKHAAIGLDTFYTVNSGGVQTFYCSARMVANTGGSAQ